MKSLALSILLLSQSNDRLIQDLKHMDPDARESAATLLGIYRARTAVRPLIDVLEIEAVSRVRSRVVDALKLITGKDFGTSYADWNFWWNAEGIKTFAAQAATKEELEQIMKPEMEKWDRKIHEAESSIRTLGIVVVVIALLFVGIMFIFVGNVSSKLKEWKATEKQTEIYLREGQEITKRTDKILEELESKKIEILGFIGKLKEEIQAEMERFTDLLQQNMDHRIREEVMELRQRSEKEIEQTLTERKGMVEHEIRRVVSENKEKVDKSIAEQHARFLRDVDAHTVYLEASFFKAGGKLEEALRLYKKIVASKPDHAVAWREMGTVLRDLTRFDEAVEAFQRALELAPEDPSALYHLAAAYARQRKRREMLDSLSKAVRNDGEFKDEALNDPAFRDYWRDPAFRDLAEA